MLVIVAQAGSPDGDRSRFPGTTGRSQYSGGVDRTGRAVLVYDGDCGFCSAAAAWITAKWNPAAAEAVPSQRLNELDLKGLGLTDHDVEKCSWWVERDRKSHGHLAIARPPRARRAMAGD
jgi:hypothetical protein